MRCLMLMVALLASTSVNADDCVVFASSIGTSGPEDYAMPATINAALLQAWNSSLDLFSAQGMGVAESFALKCIVPRNCVAPDAGIFTPDERTIFPFVVDRLR